MTSIETRPKLLVFLAAGASLDLGIPSTASLTRSIIRDIQKPTTYSNPVAAKAYLKALLLALGRCYKRPNFEHVQHGLEALSALIRSQNPNTAVQFRIVEAFLTSGLHPTFPMPVDPVWLIAIRHQFFHTLRVAMASADQSVILKPHWAAISGFLRQLNNEFDLYVATTNYDSIVEQALGWGPQLQGFEPIPGESPFRYSGHMTPPRLLHMHGSLSFGYRDHGSDPNRFVFEDDHEDLYYHPDPSKAFLTWFGRSSQTSMAGRDTLAGPIITGLDKPDKLLPEPYLSYYRRFQEFCTTIPRVLIAGYGFTDVHLNAVLGRLTRWHGPRRRIAVIDYWKPSSWAPSSAWARDKLHFFRTIAQLAEDPMPLNCQSWPDPWPPQGHGKGLLEVYFRGMAETINNHEDRIVTFLRS
jgi:hypothetical protein